MWSSPEPETKCTLKVEMKRRQSRRTRRRLGKKNKRSRTRQRGGMQSPIKEAELAGVPIVAGRKQALVFRPVDRTDPHGSTDALVDMDYVANEYDPFGADPA